MPSCRQYCSRAAISFVYSGPETADVSYQRLPSSALHVSLSSVALSQLAPIQAGHRGSVVQCAQVGAVQVSWVHAQRSPAPWVPPWPTHRDASRRTACSGPPPPGACPADLVESSHWWACSPEALGRQHHVLLHVAVALCPGKQAESRPASAPAAKSTTDCGWQDAWEEALAATSSSLGGRSCVVKPGQSASGSASSQAWSPALHNCHFVA